MSSRAPVAAAIRLAARSPRSVSAWPAQQQHYRGAGSAGRRPGQGGGAGQQVGRCRDLGFVNGLGRGGGPRGRRRGAVGPRHVGGQYQRRDLAAGGCGHGAHRVPGQVAGVAAGVHPAGHGTGEGLDVGLQRRVVPDVVGGVGADDGHQRAACPAGVVQVGEPVGQAWPQVQQHRGGPASDPRVAVGRPGRDPLEQRQHPAHVRHGIKGADEVHLRRAWVHEAHVDARFHQAGDQRLSPDHRYPPGPAVSNTLTGTMLGPVGPLPPTRAPATGTRNQLQCPQRSL